MRIKDRESQELMAAQIYDAQLKLVTVSYDKSVSYTTVIIFGGYAGIFSIWNLSKNFISKDQALWSAIFILISLFVFIAFEVTKMIFVTQSTIKNMEVLQNPNVKDDPLQFIAAMNALNQLQKGAAIKLVKFWYISSAVTIIFAVAGAGILCYSFIQGLAR